MADEQLGAELDLSTDAALSAVDALTTTLTDGLTSATDTFETAITGAMDAATAAVPQLDTTLTVDADVAPAEAALAEVVAAGDATAIDIPVEADTSGAQTGMEDLGSSAETASTSVSSATGSVRDFGGASEAAGAAAGLAVGSTSELGGAVSGLSGGMGAAIGAGTALAVTTREIFQAGVDATGAEQRFNTILGESAKAMETIHVGTLNQGLGELALHLGDTKANLENTTATLFQFAQNSGASRDASVQFAQNVDALAARAVALNPALGSVSDVADSMSARLARGGRFAASFGVSLTSAEINSRALADTGKSTAADLTIYEKSAAAAELATTKYGNSLGTTVADGANNATIVQRRLKAEFDTTLETLGKPLVIPIFNLIEAGLPIVASFGSVVGAVAQNAIPALTAAASAVGPPLSALSSALQLIGPAIGPAVEGFLAFEAVTTVLPAILGLVEGAALALAIAFPAIEEGALGAGAAVETFDVAVTSTPIGLIAAGLAAAAVAFGILGNSSGDATSKMNDTAKAMENLSSAHLVESFDAATHSLDNLGLGAAERAAVGLRQFKAVAEEDVGTAERLLTALNAAGQNTDGYRAILDHAIASEHEAANAKRDSAAATQQATATQVDQTQAYSASVTALQQYAAGTLSASDAVKALSGASSELKAQMDLLLGNYVSQQQASITYLGDLQKQNDGLVATGFNLNAFTQAGRDNQSALLTSASAAEAYGTSIVNAGGTIAAAVAPLESFRGQLANIQSAMAAAGADHSFVDGLIANVDGAIAHIQGAAGPAGAAGADVGKSAGTGVKSGEGAAQAAGTAVGAAVPAGFAQGAATLPGVASSSVLNSTNAAQLAGANAHNVGYGIGASLSSGIGDGIIANDGYVKAQAVAVIDHAEAAARAKAQAASPSKLFAALGEDLAAGVAVGIGTGSADVGDAMAGLVSPGAPPGASPGGGSLQLSPASINALANAMGRAPGARGGGGPGLVIQNATIGSSDVLADLDYFSRKVNLALLAGN